MALVVGGVRHVGLCPRRGRPRLGPCHAAVSHGKGSLCVFQLRRGAQSEVGLCPHLSPRGKSRGPPAGGTGCDYPGNYQSPVAVRQMTTTLQLKTRRVCPLAMSLPESHSAKIRTWTPRPLGLDWGSSISQPTDSILCARTQGHVASRLMAARRASATAQGRGLHSPVRTSGLLRGRTSS